MASEMLKSVTLVNLKSLYKGILTIWTIKLLFLLDVKPFYNVILEEKYVSHNIE